MRRAGGMTILRGIVKRDPSATLGMTILRGIVKRDPSATLGMTILRGIVRCRAPSKAGTGSVRLYSL